MSGLCRGNNSTAIALADFSGICRPLQVTVQSVQEELPYFDLLDLCLDDVPPASNLTAVPSKACRRQSLKQSLNPAARGRKYCTLSAVLRADPYTCNITLRLCEIATGGRALSVRYLETRWLPLYDPAWVGLLPAREKAELPQRLTRAIHGISSVKVAVVASANIACAKP